MLNPGTQIVTRGKNAVIISMFANGQHLATQAYTLEAFEKEKLDLLVAANPERMQ